MEERYTTAKRWRYRKASSQILPTTAATGHMPFKGHRPQSDVGEAAQERFKASVWYQRRASVAGERHRNY